ncbi:MAG: hypothetical protein ACR2NM_16600, partial [Bythopirellula sp.]
MFVATVAAPLGRFDPLLVVNGQIASTRLKILVPPRLAILLAGGGVLLAEVFNTRIAITATDFIQVKLQILSMAWVEHPKQKTAQLLARGAGEPLATPNGPQRVHTGVTLTGHGRQLVNQVG